MAKKKSTRRSISLKGLTYQRLKNYCEAERKSVSGYLEEIIAEKLDAAKVPMPKRLEPRPEKPVTSEDIADQHFTF